MAETAKGVAAVAVAAGAAAGADAALGTVAYVVEAAATAETVAVGLETVAAGARWGRLRAAYLFCAESQRHTQTNTHKTHT